MTRTFTKVLAGIAGLLLMIIVASCGESSTPAATIATPSGTNTSSSLRVVGTIDKYDATAKSLTVKDANGADHVISLSTARIVKNQKITQQQLSALLTATGIAVLATGTQGATADTIKAQTVIVQQPNLVGMNGNQPTGTPRANRTPRATRTAGRAFAYLKSVKLTGTQLVGTNQAGKTITVDLSGTPTIFEQSAGTDSDLVAGQPVVVTLTYGKPNEARVVVVGDSMPTGNYQAQ